MVSIARRTSGSRSVKEIYEAIQVNEITIALDTEKEIVKTDDWEVWTGTEWASFSGIKKSTHDKVVSVQLSNGESLTVTLMHEFVTPNGSIRAKDLSTGDVLADGIVVESVEFVDEVTDVYDLLEVEDDHCYETNGVVSHNCAFIPTIEDIWTAAFPTLSRGGSAIIISTPNGVGNFFYKTWVGAGDDVPSSERNLFHRIFCHWTQVPEQRGFDPIPEGWTFEQVLEEAKKGKWYQTTRPQFDNRRWAQEFEGDFLGSGNTVIDQEILKDMQNKTVPPKLKLDEQFNEVEFGDFWIWDEPKEDRYYIVGVDIASGDGTDYSAFQVLDVFTGEQVAEYKGRINLLDYSKFVAKVGEYYNYAMLVPEVTGMGVGVVQKLILEVGYENIYKAKNEQTLKQQKSAYGWKTTSQTRPLIIQAVINYTRDCQWKSSRLWNELSTFVWKQNGKAEADHGNNDDLVLALGIAAHNRETAIQGAPVEIIKGPSPLKKEYRDEFGDLIKVREQDNDISWLLKD